MDPYRSAVRISAIYLVLASLWIVFSGRAVEALFPEPGAQALAQTGKGLLFIVGSSALVFALVHRDSEARRRVERQYQMLVDQSLAGFYALRGPRFLFVNARFAEIFGYSPDELLSSVDPLDLVAPEDRALVGGRLHQRENGEVDEVRYRFSGRRKDGKPVRVEVHGRRVEWDGRPAVTGILLDVTEAERREELHHRSQRLEALGQLVGAVAHDLRNMLTAIVPPIELARAQLDPSHPASENLVEACDGASRATSLVQQLLAVSRQRAYRPRPLLLSELVRQMEPMLARLIGEGVELRLDLSSEASVVRVDPGHFEQVLMNLVLNGAEAVGERGTVEVRTGLQRDGAEGGATVFLEVEDDGRGMDREVRLRVFEPFFTTKGRGTGLGLATVHGIVTQAGGTIEVASAPGKGSTFRIRLPASDQEAVPFSGDAASAPPERGARARGSGTVLVVEDDEAVRRVTTRVLMGGGYVVLEAADGAGALDLVRERGGEIDLLLTDVGLPDIDGIELADTVLRQRPGIALLYMSGRATDEVLERLASASDRTVIEKPYLPETLLDQVEDALNRASG